MRYPSLAHYVPAKLSGEIGFYAISGLFIPLFAEISGGGPPEPPSPRR
jgi:hypothetical protein